MLLVVDLASEHVSRVDRAAQKWLELMADWPETSLCILLAGDKIRLLDHTGSRSHLQSSDELLAFLTSQALSWRADVVVLLGNYRRLNHNLLASLGRVVHQNSGYLILIAGSKLGFWSWRFAGFGLDPEGILAIRKDLLVSEQAGLLRHRRNSSAILPLLPLQLGPPFRWSTSTSLRPCPYVDRLTALAAALPLAALRSFPCASPSLGVIIPTRDRADLLVQAVESLQRQELGCAIEVVIVDNGSVETATQQLFEQLSSQPMPTQIVSYPGVFNYSAICNLGIRNTNASHILLLNNDVTFTRHNSLRDMLELTQLEPVGCVGAALMYPDARVQHLGVEISGDFVTHQFHRRRLAESSPFLVQAREVSAVTGACMMFRRTLWAELGGFDDRLPVDFNDVDFCLRSELIGYSNLLCPTARAIHLESATRGKEHHPSFEGSLAHVHRRWSRSIGNDPFIVTSEQPLR
jgi:GT2 family glycosyltransferase